MLTEEQAEAFAAEWYAAWNSNDLDRVLAHWADDAVFTSPFVVQFVGESSGTVRGKDALRDYWARGAWDVGHRFEPISLLVGADSIVLHYYNHNHRLEAAEMLMLGDDGLAHRGIAHYRPMQDT